jgi:hypothetical protein
MEKEKKSPLYTEWPKNHVTEKQSNISVMAQENGLIFYQDKGMFTLHIHKDKAKGNLFKVSPLTLTKKCHLFTYNQQYRKRKDSYRMNYQCGL